MKRFVVIHKFRNASYGQNVTQKIYSIKRNKLILLGENHFNTGSMRGEDHEAAVWLVRNKHIPKTWITPGTGYINFDVYDTYNEGKGKYNIQTLNN